MNLRGKEMDFGFIFFLLGVVCFLGMFYFYNKKEDGKYNQTLEIVKVAEAKVKSLEKLINGNIETVSLCNRRVTEVEKLIDSVKDTCKTLDFDIDALNARSEKLKETQIELQDKLSRKRPVITLSQPIPVEVKNGGGINSLIKQSSKKAKELGQ